MSMARTSVDCCRVTTTLDGRRRVDGRLEVSGCRKETRRMTLLDEIRDPKGFGCSMIER